MSSISSDSQNEVCEVELNRSWLFFLFSVFHLWPGNHQKPRLVTSHSRQTSSLLSARHSVFKKDNEAETESASSVRYPVALNRRSELWVRVSLWRAANKPLSDSKGQRSEAERRLKGFNLFSFLTEFFCLTVLADTHRVASAGLSVPSMWNGEFGRWAHVTRGGNSDGRFHGNATRKVGGLYTRGSRDARRGFVLAEFVYLIRHSPESSLNGDNDGSKSVFYLWLPNWSQVSHPHGRNDWKRREPLCWTDDELLWDGGRRERTPKTRCKSGNMCI